MNIIQALAKGRDAACNVVSCWESGDLAAAVRELAMWIGEADAAIAPELFHPDRLPPRDEGGRVYHPDVDFIVPEEVRDGEYDLALYLQGVGLEWHSFTEDFPTDDNGDSPEDVLWFNPPSPGASWRLLSINDNEDGEAVAVYVRKKPAPDADGWCSCVPPSVDVDSCPRCGGKTTPF